MPTYEYACRSCNHRFEKWQKMSDQPLTICPVCGGSIHRVLYPAGIVFKGSGFYKTDHAGSATPAAASANGATASDGKASSTAEKGEAKPAGESKPAASASTSTTAESKAS